MLQSLKASWQAFRGEAPGRRFAQRYARRQHLGHSPLRRGLQLALGGLLIVLGLFFLVAPGPGFIPLAIGGALMAEESLAVARLLDRLELRIRSWLGR